MKPALLLAAALLAAPAAAKDKPPASARESADRFTLDLAPADEDTTVTTAEAAAEPARRKGGGYTIDTPIDRLIADDRARAVLDRDMPGLSSDKNLDKFRTLSLRKLAPLSGGRLSEALLAKVGQDLAEAR